MYRGLLVRPHLKETDVHPSICKLERRFASRKSGADYVDRISHSLSIANSSPTHAPRSLLQEIRTASLFFWQVGSYCMNRAVP